MNSSSQVLLPVTYFGQDRNKPLFMAFGTCLMGVGSLTMTLPYFLGPSYSFSQPRPDTCDPRPSNESACVGLGEDLRSYKWLFWIGNLLSGIGTSPYFTLGVAYLDENFHRTVSSKYIGKLYVSVFKPVRFSMYLLEGITKRIRQVSRNHRKTIIIIVLHLQAYAFGYGAPIN